MHSQSRDKPLGRSDFKVPSDVHSQGAPTEVEDALRFVGDELRGDLEEAAARVDDDADLAQDLNIALNEYRLGRSLALPLMVSR